jgi:hypothetical protein
LCHYFIYAYNKEIYKNNKEKNKKSTKQREFKIYNALNNYNNDDNVSIKLIIYTCIKDDMNYNLYSLNINFIEHSPD